MVNQYLFIEEGSLAPNDIAKIVENVKNTGTSIIMYNKGCAKPEFVSFGEVDVNKIKTEAAEKEEKNMLDALENFLRTNCAQYRDMDYERNGYHHFMKYPGSSEVFIEHFRTFLHNHKGDDAWT